MFGEDFAMGHYKYRAGKAAEFCLVRPPRSRQRRSGARVMATGFPY